MGPHESHKNVSHALHVTTEEVQVEILRYSNGGATVHAPHASTVITIMTFGSGELHVEVV